MILWFAVRLRLARLSRWKIATFQDLTDELYWAQSYGELFGLIDKHYKQLFSIAYRDTRGGLLKRWHEPQQEQAQEILRTILLSPRVVDAFATTRPYLALALTREWLGRQGIFEFVELYIKGL